MAETCMINGEAIIELPGRDGVILCDEDEYLEIIIEPAGELREIESSVTEARESGADLLPAVLILEICRSFAGEGMEEDYCAAMNILSAICRNLSGSGGGRLKPVGDYLGFYID